MCRAAALRESPEEKACPTTREKAAPVPGAPDAARDPLPKWYAVQVETGREDAACALVLRAAEAEGLADAFDELFSPKRRTLSKVRGELVRGWSRFCPDT